MAAVVAITLARSAPGASLSMPNAVHTRTSGAPERFGRVERGRQLVGRRVGSSKGPMPK
jgi:hypothetical protein